MTNKTEIKSSNPLIDDDPAMLHNIKLVDRQRGAGDFDNMLPVVDVQIPASVVIGCPMVRQHLSQAKNCKTCDHFNGIVQTSYNDEGPMQWDHKFAISCRFPLDRKCSSVCFSVEG